MKTIFVISLFLLILPFSKAVIAKDKENFGLLNKHVSALDKNYIKNYIIKYEKLYSGIVYDFEHDFEDQRLVLKIKLISLDSDKKHKFMISAKSGKVINHESERLFSWFVKPQKVENVINLQKSQINVIDQIFALKTTPNAIFLEFELEEEQGITFLEIEYLTKNGVVEYLININSGDIIPVLGKN